MEEETDIISDIGIEHYDELDYEIKLEDNDEEEPSHFLLLFQIMWEFRFVKFVPNPWSQWKILKNTWKHIQILTFTAQIVAKLSTLKTANQLTQLGPF